MGHTSLSDQEFEEQFAACYFPVSDFTHDAHLRLVWIHIKNYGLEKAILNVSAQLQNFVTQAGAAEKFNLTLTLAAIHTVYHFYFKADSDDFEGLLLEHPQLSEDFKSLLLTHYSQNLLFSERARSEYHPPDLLPY